MTTIKWTDETWNPVTGCTKVSPGCAYCYAERVDHRFDHDKVGKLSWELPASRGGRPVTLHPDRLDQPLRWQKPRRIFVNSMSDLFHEDVPDEFLDRVFAVMALAPQHTFQVLTKRAQRALAYMTAEKRLVSFDDGTVSLKPASTPTKILWQAQAICDDGFRYKTYPTGLDFNWPLPNAWLGVSVENQHWAEVRLPILAQIPASVRFVAVEPLLGPVDLTPWLPSLYGPDALPGLDWCIVGGESGGPEHRRLVWQTGHVRQWPSGDYSKRYWTPKPPPSDEPRMHAISWVRSLRDQCQAAGIPYFLKQWGGPTLKSGGRLLEGREWNEMPEVNP